MKTRPTLIALLLPMAATTVDGQDAASFIEPRTAVEEKIFQKLLERRTFAAAEINEIDQSTPKDGVIDARDLALYYKANPKPPYAFFPESSSGLVSGVNESTTITAYLTKPFTGRLWYQLSGDALKDVDFQLVNGETKQAGSYVGFVSVTNATTAAIPVQMAPKSKLTGSKSLVVALISFRDVANEGERSGLLLDPVKQVGYRVRQADENTVWRATAINSSTKLATWAQEPGVGYDVGPASAHRVELNEADCGLYRGNLRFYNGSGLNQQAFFIAIRSSGHAFFDTTEAKLFKEPFSVPINLYKDGTFTFEPEISKVNGALPRITLGKSVDWTLALEEQSEAVIADETERLALNLVSRSLVLGDRVRQTDDQSIWTLIDDRFPSSRASWRIQSPASRIVVASLEFANLTASSFTARGCLDLILIEPVLEQ